LPALAPRRVILDTLGGSGSEEGGRRKESGASYGASAREDLRRNCCSAGSRGKKCVVRRSIGSKGRHFTGAGSASSLARLGAWFFPESDEVIGEIAAAGCRNQPGEKSEDKIAGKPMPSRHKRENYHVDDRQAKQEEKGSDAQR
jgi:hypothetical protein